MSEPRMTLEEYNRLRSGSRGEQAVLDVVNHRFPQANKLQALHDQANAAYRQPARPVKPTEPVQPTARKRSNGEIMLEAQLLEAGLTFVTEHRFVRDRSWRLDFAFLDAKLAVEVQGAVHRIKGRFHSDIEKENRLTLEGWALLQFRPAQIKDGLAVPLIKKVLELRRLNRD